MKTRSVALFAAAIAIASGCGSDDSDHSSNGGGPKAPTELSASPLAGGAHLTWRDNSADEEHFMVLRQQVGTDTEFETVSTLPFDTTLYHDAPLTVGATYKYKIMAMNAAGESESNEVMVTIP
jgi:hypothetical protein